MTTNGTSLLDLGQSVIATLASGALLLMLAGCQGGPVKPADMPELTPCTITVTYQGRPVEGATVTLAPKSGKFPAAGNTDAAGRAVLKTNAMFGGAVAGEFLVSITKLEIQASGVERESSSDPAEYAKTLQSVAAAPKSLIPERYSSFKTSGLTLTVVEGSSVEKTFELTDSGKGE